MDILSFYKGKKVLLTGHTGFKGSWLCRILVNAGAEVIGYSQPAPTNPNLFELCDVEDKMNSRGPASSDDVIRSSRRKDVCILLRFTESRLILRREDGGVQKSERLRAVFEDSIRKNRTTRRSVRDGAEFRKHLHRPSGAGTLARNRHVARQVGQIHRRRSGSLLKRRLVDDTCSSCGR